MTDTPEASNKLLSNIAQCVQTGRVDADTKFPPDSHGQPGVVEWIDQAIADRLPPKTILEQGLMAGMTVIGKKFAANEVFIPEVLIAARAMHAGIKKLKPLFADQNMPSRGVFVIGTVQGDLHDIGKNLVCVMLEGAGWRMVDLGVDCPTQRFLDALEQYPGCIIGLSALLSTTMVAMRDTVAVVRQHSPDTVILVGGAPVTDEFARQIGATACARDPLAARDFLDGLMPPV